MPGDGKEQYVEQYQRIAAQNGGIAQLRSLGRTHLGRDIWAMKITKDAKTLPDNSRPAVLYNAIQHSREWLAGETCRRTLDYFVENHGTDERVTRLVDTRELWFSCISNPDGYEHSLTEGNRLWRKNMADNDGDGILGEPGDGVGPNRNFATNWGRDNEGSSDDPASETYRGPGRDSEPETRAMKALWNSVDFELQKNDHTAAELLLCPQGFQLYTPAPDNGIFEALAGDERTTFPDSVFARMYNIIWELQGERLIGAAGCVAAAQNAFDKTLLYATDAMPSDARSGASRRSATSSPRWRPRSRRRASSSTRRRRASPTVNTPCARSRWPSSTRRGWRARSATSACRSTAARAT